MLEPKHKVIHERQPNSADHEYQHEDQQSHNDTSSGDHDGLSWISQI